MENKRAKALTWLICHFLRGGVNTSAMNVHELRSYMARVGVALHNLPHYIDNVQHLELDQLIDIDNLDPTSTPESWGDVVKHFGSNFGCIPLKV